VKGKELILASENEDGVEIISVHSSKAFVYYPNHVLHCIIAGVAGIIPTAIPLPARISPPHGLALKRHAPAQFRRNLHKEALLTSSDSEDDGDSAGTAAKTSKRAGSSKEDGSAYSLVPDPRLRISTSKVSLQ
jgi:hypothetical protein